MKSLLVCFTIASDRQMRNTAFMSALIETRALTRMDERRQVPLLQPTDFSLKRADRVSITGTSGSGKSVFLRALALLDAPSSGRSCGTASRSATPRFPTTAAISATCPNARR